MTPEQLNKIVSLVLRLGMWLSLGIMIVGLVWYAVDPVPSEVIPVEKVLDQLFHGNPIAMLELGILVLIATPFLRLLTALAAFVYSKQYKFVLVSLVVIAIVLLGIFIKV
ncbi:MAG: hypothetical protein A4E32_00445 [Methanomassiliicoccales archaeon PtaU1.Bin124]|nr:MAG: hypothetical protein A4E32_00445 [Methanomassiliicoccales archaeon PtaU1.Bin124]